MLLAPEIARFVAWFAAFQSEIGEVVRTSLNAQFAAQEPARMPTQEDTRSRGADISGPIALEWGQWLDASARPELLDMREAVHDSLAMLQHASPVVDLHAKLERAIAGLPESIVLDGSPTGADGPDERTQVEVPLRRLFELGFGLPTKPAFEQLERSLERALQDMSRRIEEAEKVLDYYTLAVQRHSAEIDDAAQAEEFAHTGLSRVEALIGDLHRRRSWFARRAIAKFVDRSGGALEEASAPFRAHRPQEVRERLKELERLHSAGPPAPAIHRRLGAQAQRSYHAVAPFVRQLASEVHALFTDQAPESIRRAYTSLLAADPSELGRELPSSYRRLFATIPIEIADMYIPRAAIEDACAAAIEKWRAQIPQSMLLHGDRGAGKRTVANLVLARVRSQAHVHWIRLGPNLRDEPAVAKALGRVLGLGSDARSFAALLRAGSPDTRRRVVVIENTERLLSPSAEGIARMDAFLGLVRATAPTTLWLLLMATPAAALVLYRLQFANRIPTIVHVEPMSHTDIRALIEERHRLSGFELEFSEPGERLLARVRRPIAGFRATRARRDTYFKRLWRLSGGNPRQAMYYWLACAASHSQREGRIVVGPLPETSVDLLPPVTISQRLILALIAQHGSLTGAELQDALAAPGAGVDGDIKVLWANGYLMPSPEARSHMVLRSTMAHPLLMELRSANMI